METSEVIAGRAGPSRPPFKEGALPSPGDSIREFQIDLVFGRLLPAFLAACVLCGLAFNEWLAAIGHWARHPWIYTVLAALGASAVAFQFWRTFGRLEDLKLGRQGERVVGQQLEELRALGAKVFHDVPGDGFNLDHVVLCSRGFFVVETKTRSKPERGQSRVTMTANAVCLADRAPTREPIEQVQAAAGWLRQLLAKSTGHRGFPVKGVVTFPGWFVEPMTPAWKSSPELPWILSPSGLRAFIAHERTRVTEEDVSLAALHLERYVRARLVELAKQE